MSVTTDTFLVSNGLGQCLSHSDTDILDGMMVVDMQITLRFYFQIDQTVTGDLIQHVVEKRNAGSKILPAGTVQIDCHVDFRLVGVTDDFRCSGR